MKKAVVRNLDICATLWSQFGCWYCYKIRWDIIRDQPIYRLIFGFYRYIGIGQNNRFYWPPLGVDKTLLYSSCIQTTCARKHNEASQDSYFTATLAGAVS